jgi:hypothetical protein
MNLNEHREILRKNDLEMMKKLDKIIYDAKPKPVPEVKPVIPKAVYMQQELTGTPEYKATKQQANLLLTQQLDSIISSAMSAVSGKTPEKDTKVSQEAQDEYQSMTPIEVGGKQQLYYDVPIPPLPPFVPKPYTSRFTDLAAFKTEKERLLRELDTSYNIRTVTQEEIKLVENEINAKSYANPIGFTPKTPPFDRKARNIELITLTEIRDPKDPLAKVIIDNQPLKDICAMYGIPTRSNSAIPTLVKNILAFEEGEYEKAILAEESTFVGTKVMKAEMALTSDLARLHNTLKMIEGQILKNETDLGALDADYANFERTNEENTIEENKINNERRLLATDTLNTFNRLNQGRVQIQREPQETDDELLARLDKLGQIPVDAVDVENQILLKAKKNILELTPDLTVGELVLKKLTPDEQHMMNKIFPKIKKNFSD